MGAHAARRGPRHALGRGLAAVLGAGYGVAAGLLDRQAGAPAGRAVVLGAVAGVVVMLVALLVGRRLRMLPRIPRAGVLAAVVGAAGAFLVGISPDATTLRALASGVLLAAAAGLACFAFSSPRR